MSDVRKETLDPFQQVLESMMPLVQSGMAEMLTEYDEDGEYLDQEDLGVVDGGGVGT